MSSADTQTCLEQHFVSGNPSGGNRADATVNNGSTKPNKPRVHPTQAYLRTISQKLPKVDNDGIPYIIEAGATGKQAANEAVKLSSKSKLRHCLDTHFPNYPIHFATDPKRRAEECRGAMFWTEKTMVKARDEFVIPSEMKTIIICPEISDRDFLAEHTQYQTTHKGIMSPCLKCKTHFYMKQTGWTSMRPSCQQSLNKEMTHDVILGATYACFNIDSGCCKVNPNTDRKSPSTFTAYEPEFWSQYPKEVRDRYSDFVTRIEDKSTKLMVSPGLVDKLLFGSGTFEDFTRKLDSSLQQRCDRASNKYYAFVKEQLTKMPAKPESMTQSQYDSIVSRKWPTFDEDIIREYSKMPTSDTVQKMFHDAFGGIEHYLYRDLFSRGPGRILRMDGTFDIMAKTMDTPTAGESNNVLLKILGEYGHLVTYAFCEGERNEVKERLLWFLMKRMQRNGQSLWDVIAAYDDVCCRNLDDPTDHYLPLMFKSCKRAPLKDAWHGVQVVLRETAGFGHPLHDAFAAGIWGLLLKWDQASSDEALDHFTQHNENGKRIRSRELARVEMMRNERYKSSVDNYISAADISETVRGVKDLYLKTKAMDLELEREAGEKGDGYRRYFKREIKGIQAGSEAAIENFVSHLEKGCFVDPLPCSEMSYLKSSKVPNDGGPPRKKRRRGTNVVEINNKYGARATVDHVTRQGSDLTHKKFLLFTLVHNLACDEKIEHITGKKARTRNWFVRESLRNEVGEHVSGEMFPGEQYPAEFDESLHMEPVGNLYPQYKEWESIDRKLRMFYDQARETLRENAAASQQGQASGAIIVSNNPSLATATGQGESFGASASLVLRSDLPAIDQSPVIDPQFAFSERLTRKKSSCFGSEVWGTRTAGFPVVTAQTLYINGPLNFIQQSKLAEAYSFIYSHSADRNSMNPSELYARVEDVFNVWHLRQLVVDQVGFGGKVRLKQVEEYFKGTGRSMLKGRLGLKPTLQPGAAMPPTVLNVGIAPHAMEAKAIEQLSQKKCRAILKSLGLSTNGITSELQKRLKKHYRV